MGYDFDLIKEDKNLLLEPKYIKEQLSLRASLLRTNKPPSPEEEQKALKTIADKYVPSKELLLAINTAIYLGMPILITGEAGVGKTEVASYIAGKLSLTLYKFWVKSDSTARDLLYRFNSVGYFADAQTMDSTKIDKERHVEPVYLGKAIKDPDPIVLLVDEIDKASRDFPNDLLNELDKWQFKVLETGQEYPCADHRPIVVITSNGEGERQLPSPFLRRCIYHHISYSDDLLKKILDRRKDEFKILTTKEIEIAINRFSKIRDEAYRKPTIAEFLQWLRVLNINFGKANTEKQEEIRAELKSDKLPYPQVLLKNPDDLKKYSKDQNI